MKQIIIIFTITLIYSQLYSQDYPTRRELKKLFSERQEYFGEFSWEVCNDDGTYYKNDTIVLYYRNSTCFEERRCCEYVDWTFYNTRSFQLGKTKTCQEPPISSLGIAENPYSIKIKGKSNKLELQIESHDKHLEVFRIEKLVRCEGESKVFGYRLTLKRKK